MLKRSGEKTGAKQNYETRGDQKKKEKFNFDLKKKLNLI
jgi:hypothetical protein